MSDKQDELKACPFCGLTTSHETWCYIYILVKAERKRDYTTATRIDKLTKAWNTRQEDAEIKKLRNDCKNLVQCIEDQVKTIDMLSKSKQ